MQLSERLNVAEVLVDSHMSLGRGAKAAILCAERTVRYADLYESVNRVGNALDRHGRPPRGTSGDSVCPTGLNGPLPSSARSRSARWPFR